VTAAAGIYPSAAGAMFRAAQSAPRKIGRLLGSAPTGNKLQDEHNECYHQQDVNESTGDVEAEAERPKNEQEE
jgi:hypothetical protein